MSRADEHTGPTVQSARSRHGDYGLCSFRHLFLGPMSDVISTAWEHHGWVDESNHGGVEWFGAFLEWDRNKQLHGNRLVMVSGPWSLEIDENMQ
ncbi:hypothetical protein HNY73_017876 [Argiope bruennichi]|uniref:Uncharacterized protein n=1 Tax=Argiope bruennichi TaxID=94029 RepID=A0A8T0EC10_ARGBR|nr:hypothetical protein HNY73_017876 [Argiope bruennichi]